MWKLARTTGVKFSALKKCVICRTSLIILSYVAYIITILAHHPLESRGCLVFLSLSKHFPSLLFHFVGAKIWHLPGFYYSVVTSFCDNCMDMSVFYISYKSQLTTYLHVCFCFFFQKMFHTPYNMENSADCLHFITWCVWRCFLCQF